MHDFLRIRSRIACDVCIFTIKLCHDFTINLFCKSREINFLTVSGYYPVS